MVPVATVARQSRSFDTKDGTHLAAAYFGDQTLETRALNQAGTSTPEIFIDDVDLLKAQLASTILQPILTALAFLMMEYLVRCRLANVDERFARKALSGELRLVHLPLRGLVE
jgi:hypothetical protein